jgi:hypothetical protein
MMKPTLLAINFLLVLNALSACTPDRPAPLTPDNRFVKKQADGKAIPILNGPWACVEDTQTGLHWEVKSPNENSQYSYSTYSWRINERGNKKGGSCGVDRAGMAWVEYQACDTQDLIDHLNRTRLCGLSDWRLPTALELRSIMLHHPYPGERMLPFTLLPRIPHSPYWTSEYKEQDGRMLAQTIHLGNGEEHWVQTANVANVIAVQGKAK